MARHLGPLKAPLLTEAQTLELKARILVREEFVGILRGELEEDALKGFEKAFFDKFYRVGFGDGRSL